MDEKESVLMVIRAIETDSIDRVEDIVGRLIDLFNSDESREFLENKIQQARDGLIKLEDAMKVSLYDGMQVMRQLVTDVRIHLWSSDAAISRFQFRGQSLHYLLTHASDVLKDKSLTNEEKVKKIWDGITGPLTQDEDKEKATQRLEEFLNEWRQASKLPEPDKQRLENQIRTDFDRGLRQQHTEIEDLFTQLREHFEGLRAKLDETNATVKEAERRGTTIGVMCGGGIAAGVVGIVGLGTTLASPLTPLGAAFTATVTGDLIGLAGTVLGLVGTGVSAVNGALVGRGEAHKEIKNRGGERFLNRKHPSWYPRIENLLFDYISGNMTDDALSLLIRDERLEEDLCHIRDHLQRWILSCRDLLDKTKIPVLSKKAFILEARRTWAFAKALLLDESEYVEHHSELLSQLINAALSSGNDVAPFISVARLPDGNQTLKLKLIARQNADMLAVHALVCDIAELAGVTAQVGFSNVKGTYVYEIKIDETDGVKRFIGVIAKQTGRLAEVHVRAALLGEYDVNVGSRLTNPAFNRIYGPGLSAPGFRPTVFNRLNYSGEIYYCPTGWRRVSINVADSAAEFDRKYGGWHVAYHGTNHELASTVLTSGFLPARGAYSDGEAVVYFSPSIEYAAHPRYARVYEVPDKSEAKKYMQMILQVRVNPKNIWKKVGGTLPGAFDPENRHYNEARDNSPADPNFPDNRNLEWLVKPIPGTSGIDMFKNMFVIYGVMIRVNDTDPKTHPANAWWLMK